MAEPWRGSRGLGQGKELQLETLAQLARTHARGVQVSRPESDVQLLGPICNSSGTSCRQLSRGCVR